MITINNRTNFIYSTITDMIFKCDELLDLWITNKISDDQIELYAKMLFTSYSQLDLTKELPVVKYD